MHVNSSKIKLDLEADVNISSVDGGTPPESKSSVRNLVETRSLSMGKNLILH